MSNAHLEKPCQQRFKGVENFLRRVAFNLGNTASQTEVKIISCIPIDVTELQQKIINLEKQLHETKQQGPCATVPVAALITSAVEDKDAASYSKPTAVVNTALFGSSFAQQSSTVSYCSDKPLDNIKSHQITTYCDDCISKQRKSNASFVFPALSTFKTQKALSLSSSENVNADRQDRNIAFGERYMNIFKKRKKKRVCKGKSKMKTHLVYFAQHDQNNPFSVNEATLNHLETLNNNTEFISRSYLNNVIRRQYDPKFVLEEFSNTSHFSKPVCKDNDESNTRLQYESDVYSCCHGRFQNIDNYMTKNFDPIKNMTKYSRDNSNKRYYDSNLYDIVPVRENTNKYLNGDISSKRNLEIRCWPENYRSKYRYNPVTVNYQTEVPTKRYPDKKIKLSSPQRPKCNKKPENSNVKERKRINKQDQQTGTGTSNSFSIDCSNVYKKNNYTIAKLQQSEPVETILFKNELIETDDINNKLIFHNQSTQLELIPDENKTESTLNQIKSILQSVLTEVKTNTRVNTAVEKTQKVQKDAVVQKGTSQSNMQGNSSLLHSFTYNNSYNANPFLPSCSRQVPGGQFCLTGFPYQVPMKCLQSFPVFIQSSGKPTCTCYYRNSSHKFSNNKQSTTTASNTGKEIQRPSSKETEKLIKEIYKSMALNMDFPTKDNSVSEYDDLKSSENDIINESNLKDVRSTGVEVGKRDIEIEAMISPNISHNSKLVYTSTSTHSEYGERTKESRFYKNPTKSEVNHDRILRRYEHSTDIIAEDDEETNASNNESENDGIANCNKYNTSPRSKKKGLFQRMFQSVKLFKRRKVDQMLQSEIDEEVSEVSDSDDYETVYSEIIAKRPLPVTPRKNYKSRMQSKIKSPDQRVLFQRARRSPYLEQEYRRQWNEHFMFKKQQGEKYSSERPFSKESLPKGPCPIYWNNYEARSAVVGPNFPNELKYHSSNMNMSKTLPRNSPDKPLRNNDTAKGKLGWLQRHKMGIQCGEQWKKFVLEN